MRIFKNMRFTRFADKEGITDDELGEAARLLDAGRFSADLGGGVYKMRVARPGEGKSGGYRVIVVFRSGQRMFYVYGFAKSQRANIGQKEKRNFKDMARKYLDLSDVAIGQAVKAGTLVEV